MNGNIGDESNPTIARGLELLTVGVVTASFLGLLTMRLGIFSAPRIWLSTITIIVAYRWITRQRPITAVCAPLAWQTALVVAVGLFFRLTPYLDILGGTDNAAYLNMGMELARTGGLAPVDHVLERLQDPAIQQLYKSTSYMNAAEFLPGVYSTDNGLAFQFYPLFPVWLALFESGLGVQAAVYALTFLSLVSLVYFQCLACLLTRSRRIGLAAGLLLAVNPLHAFVSKLTVSEMTLSAHTLISFFLLLMFSRACEQEGPAPKHLIWLSALALGLGFMTRINGFLYLPFLLAVFLSVMFFDDHSERRKSIMWWAVASIALYFVSVWYGLTWSAPYANDIYRLAFEPRFGKDWPFVLKIVGLVILVIVVGCWRVLLWSRRTQKLEELRSYIRVGLRFLPYAVLLMMAVFLYKAYEVGFTDAYIKDEWVQNFWGMSHKGWASTYSASLVVAAFYISPFIFIAFSIAIFRRNLLAEQRLLLIFVACFFANFSVLLWFIGNYPAVHRYLLSEFVPGVLLFTVCALAGRRLGRIGPIAMLLVLGSTWCFWFSLLQLGKREDEGAATSLNEIAATIDSGDILLISTKKFPATELQTPLTYIYGLNAIRIDDNNLRRADYLSALRTHYDEVYLLSDDDNPPSGFEFAKNVHYSVQAFKGGDFPPTTTVKRYDLPLRLDRFVSAVNSPLAMSYDAVTNRASTQTGEVDGGTLRNKGKRGFLLYGPYKFLAPGKYHIEFSGRIADLPTGGFARLDVVSGSGTKPQAEQIVTVTGVLPSLDFSLTQAVSDIEIRLWAEPGVDAEIASYRVYRKSE